MGEITIKKELARFTKTAPKKWQKEQLSDVRARSSSTSSDDGSLIIKTFKKQDGEPKEAEVAAEVNENANTEYFEADQKKYTKTLMKSILRMRTTWMNQYKTLDRNQIHFD